ncbi:MAG: hypothetical protein AAGA68_24845 [Pseudomonadota bacterium]
MPDFWGKLISAKSAIIVVMFLLPFVNVSCTGMASYTLTGLDMVVGTTIEVKDLPSFDGRTPSRVNRELVPPRPAAFVALVAAFVGLSFGLVSVAQARIVTALSSVLGMGALLTLRGAIAREAMLEGGGLIVVAFQFPFWFAFFLFLACLVASGGRLLDHFRYNTFVMRLRRAGRVIRGEA